MSSPPPKHQYPAWLAPALAKALRVNLDSGNRRDRDDENCHVSVVLDDETVEQFERIYQKIQARYAQRSQNTNTSTASLPEQHLPQQQQQQQVQPQLSASIVKGKESQTNKNEMDDDYIQEVKTLDRTESNQMANRANFPLVDHRVMLDSKSAAAADIPQFQFVWYKVIKPSQYSFPAVQNIVFTCHQENVQLKRDHSTYDVYPVSARCENGKLCIEETEFSSAYAAVHGSYWTWMLDFVSKKNQKRFNLPHGEFTNDVPSELDVLIKLSSGVKIPVSDFEIVNSDECKCATK
jgi:hypothetical protein